MNPAHLNHPGGHGPSDIPLGLESGIEPQSSRLSPLTGRDAEVDLLADRWELASDGMGQVVLISGEAGLGKSRLAHSVKTLVQNAANPPTTTPGAGSPLIEWRCSQRFENTGLHPVTEYLGRLLGFGPEEPSATRFDRLAQHLEDCGLNQPEVVALFARLLFLPPDERYPAPGLSPVRERERTFQVIAEWLYALARRQPILFVIEDLHWIDASSLEFLGQFLAGSVHHRILTVLTYRPEFLPPWPPAPHHTSIALNRLTRRQVTQLMEKSIGGKLPETLVAQVYQRTRGVPLLVEEFTRMARESAIFEQEHEREVPATLQQLVMTRLDRMASNREVAQLAATLGREFDYEMLAAVVSVDEQTLQAELAKLAAAEILFRKGSPPRCTYLFKHALLEEALHNALEAAQRQQFHRQVAEVMEARFPHSAEQAPELFAVHFTEAGLVDKAVRYWLQAGRKSYERSANLEAINHLTRGLEMLRTLDESAERDALELEFLGPLGTAYIATRGYAAPEVAPVFQRACELAARSGETPQAFAMLRGHFAYQIVRGNFRLCTDLAAEAMLFARNLGDSGILMEALFLEGLTKLYRGDFAGARASCTEALDRYDDRQRTAFWATQTGEDSGVAHRCYLSLAFWHLGFPDRALQMNRDALSLARTLNHPFSLEYALHHTGWLHQHCRLGEEAKRAGDEERGIATEQGFLFWHASGSLYTGAGLLLLGRLEEGLAMFQDGLRAYRGTGAGLGLTYYLAILGEAFTQAQRFEEARGAFDEAFALMVQNDERFQEAELYRLRGELHLAEANDEAAAEKCFQQSLAIARHQQSKAWELRTSVSLARLHQRQRRGHDALTIISALLGTFTGGQQMPDFVAAEELLQELRHDRMRDEISAGIKYVRGCIPRPISRADSPVAVDWRYIPSSTLGGDIMGYHWVDDDHLALYLLDVTGHGLDSALLAVTITNVIRSGSLADADLRRPDQVLSALNKAFQGANHGQKYFTIWYGVYRVSNRTLSYASGGHPAAVLVVPGEASPQTFPATGPVMGIVTKMPYPATSTAVPPGARLFVFSDGVFEIRRDKRNIWDLTGCTTHLALLCQQPGNVMDELLTYTQGLRGGPVLDDDFSIIEVQFQ